MIDARYIETMLRRYEGLKREADNNYQLTGLSRYIKSADRYYQLAEVLAFWLQYHENVNIGIDAERIILNMDTANYYNEDDLRRIIKTEAIRIRRKRGI